MFFIIIINDGITGIEREVFKDFTSLSEIYLSNSIKAIGPLAFKNCISLKEINIPKSVEKIYGNKPTSSPFFGCNSDLIIMIHNENCNYSKYWNYYDEEHELYTVRDYRNNYFFGTINSPDEEELYWENLDTNQPIIQIPEGITFIPDEAFDGDLTLEKIYFPSSLKRIGDYAFNHCENLNDIDFPENIEHMGVYCFYDCYKLSKVILPNSLLTLGKFGFTNIPSNKYVIILLLKFDADKSDMGDKHFDV